MIILRDTNFCTLGNITTLHLLHKIHYILGIDCHCCYFFFFFFFFAVTNHIFLVSILLYMKRLLIIGNLVKIDVPVTIWDDLLFQFVYFKGFLDLSWTFDSFRFDNVFAFGQVNSMNFRYKYFNSLRKLLRQIYDHLARLNFWKYHIFYSSSDTIHLVFPMVMFVVQPHKWLIR